MMLFMKDHKAQAMTEYVLVLAAFLGLIAIGNGPIPIIPMMVEAFDIYITSMHMVITLPIP